MKNEPNRTELKRKSVNTDIITGHNAVVISHDQQSQISEFSLIQTCLHFFSFVLIKKGDVKTKLNYFIVE